MDKCVLACMHVCVEGLCMCECCDNAACMHSHTYQTSGQAHLAYAPPPPPWLAAAAAGRWPPTPGVLPCPGLISPTPSHPLNSLSSPPGPLQAGAGRYKVSEFGRYRGKQAGSSTVAGKSKVSEWRSVLQATKQAGSSIAVIARTLELRPQAHHPPLPLPTHPHPRPERVSEIYWTTLRVFEV